jgi:hypothetical protein
VCVFVYYRERDIQRLPPDHILPVTPKFVSKVLLIVFFDQDGVVHHELFSTGQTVNNEYYLQILWPLPDAVGRKRPQHLSSGDRPIYHDNAPSHTSQLVQHFFAKMKSHKCSYLDILPTFHRVTFFISRNKTRSEREKIWRCENYKTKYDAATYIDIKNKFQVYFKLWQNCWNKCIKSQGYYFEGVSSTNLLSLIL